MRACTEGCVLNCCRPPMQMHGLVLPALVQHEQQVSSLCACLYAAMASFVPCCTVIAALPSSRHRFRVRWRQAVGTGLWATEGLRAVGTRSTRQNPALWEGKRAGRAP